LGYIVLLLSHSKSADAEWRPMLTQSGGPCCKASSPINAYRQVKLGEESPSSVVYVSNSEGGDNIKNGAHVKMVDIAECHLIDWSPEHLLVVNFDSATLPAFSKRVEEFSVADFLLVYMDETHLSEDWSVSGDSSLSFEVKKHQDRCAADHQLLEHFFLPPQCQVVAEHMDSNPNAVYDVAFEAYLGGNGPFYYNLQEIQH
uniref:Iodothyronine deiodinase n=1 Tax=Mustela putorius furo TaxID=9669 RepID=M3XU96_MUSPF